MKQLTILSAIFLPLTFIAIVRNSATVSQGPPEYLIGFVISRLIQ